MIGWILFALLLVWFFMSMRYSHPRRLHLQSYCVYLLLNDEIRGDHKRKFLDWIRTTDAKDARDLTLRATSAVENMAEQLAGTSVLAAHAVIRDVKQAGTAKARSSQSGRPTSRCTGPPAPGR